MRGDLELHPRHFIYSFSGFFSGLTARYFINKVLSADNITGSETNAISEILFYVLMVSGIMAGILTDHYVMKNKYKINYRKFLTAEVITMVVLNLLCTMLFVFAYQF